MSTRDSHKLQTIENMAREIYGVESMETILAVIADLASDGSDDEELASACEVFKSNNIDAVRLKEALEQNFKDDRKGNAFTWLTFSYDMRNRAALDNITEVTVDKCLTALLNKPTELIKACREACAIQNAGRDDPAPETKIPDSLTVKPNKKEDVEALVHRIKALHTSLSKKVLGQDNAIHVLANGLFQSRMQSITGQHSVKPAATFLFAGPPGVGKTYLARSAAEILKLPFRQFDMSEYTYDSGVEKFAGIPKNYSGRRRGLVTEFVEENPECVLLFDEIEKACEAVILLFLQILDGGRLKDNYSDKEISFSQAIIIFTTNAGRKIYENSEKLNLSSVSRKTIVKALRDDVNPRTGRPYFPAAICSRLASGNVVMFNHMEAQNLYKISCSTAKRITDSIRENLNIKFDIDPNIYSTLLFSEGGHADARRITGLTEQFLNTEIFELFRLLASDRVSASVNGINEVRLEVRVPDERKIAKLYMPSEHMNILIFADEPAANKCKRGDNHYFVSQSVSECEKIIKSTDIDLIFFDFTYGMNERDSRYLNIEDISSDGRDFFEMLKESGADIPMYILQTDEHVYSDEEKVSFSKAGVRGVIDLMGTQQRLIEIIEATSLDIHKQRSMNLLASSNQFVTYSTAQELQDGGARAVIRLFDLRLKKTVDADDRDSVMSGSSRPDTCFEDIIGADDAKEELRFFVNFLKEPRRFREMGAAVPKGIMLYGPPGTGKTMLARAVAGEADVTFIATEGNKFLSKWVGEGAERVHQIFNVARKYAPSVIFIDEIDAIIRARGESTGGYDGSDIITAFLTEMDGFSTGSKPVFVMAATNANLSSGSSAGLDPAVLRRFDRRIFVDLPDKKERIAYMQKKQEENSMIRLSDGEIESIADRSIGMSFAGLESVYEMAIRMTIRDNPENSVMTDEVFDEAFLTYQDGESRDRKTTESVLRTARHEAGHALLSVLTGGHPTYITIVSRANYGGYVMQGDENKCVFTKQELLDRIAVSLAGRAAEIVYYGSSDGITTGAGSDLVQATKLTRAMICDYGMWDSLGLAVLDKSSTGLDGNDERIKQAVNDILKERLEFTIDVIRSNRERVDRMVGILMEKNHMNGDEIRAVYGDL